MQDNLRVEVPDAESLLAMFLVDIVRPMKIK